MRAATGLALLKRDGSGRCEGFATPDLFHRGRRQLDRSSKASLAASNLVRVRVGIRVRCKCGSPRCLGYSLGRLLDAPAGEGAPPDGRQVDLEQRGAISRRELREPPLLRVGDTLRASVPLLAWSGFGLGPRARVRAPVPVPAGSRRTDRRRCPPASPHLLGVGRWGRVGAEFGASFGPVWGPVWGPVLGPGLGPALGLGFWPPHRCRRRECPRAGARLARVRVAFD